MYLTSTNIAHYLLQRGRLAPEAIVNGDLLVTEAGRRNRNFKVIQKKFPPGLFVKQIRTPEAQAMITLQRESTCYRLAQSGEEYRALAKLMPRFVDYDPARCVLVLELLPDAMNLSEHHQRLQKFPEEIGEMLGRGLGTYHSDAGRAFSMQTDKSTFACMPPWILSLHASGPAMFQQLSGGNTRLIEVLRQAPAFAQRLEELRQEWRSETLTHGDIKWENCMVFPAADGKLDFRIVDWELCDIGDPAWDAGSVLQSYLVWWIFSMPVHSESQPGRFIEQAGHKLEDMQPAMRMFWNSYRNARGLSQQDSDALLLRCVRYGAARMVQTAFEQLHIAPQLNNYAVTLLQVSLNILNEPWQAAKDLFGLPAGKTQ
ncbi:MAG TPA: phosphotransferase [Candidatus Angelobacter sp.]|nr:phosphotransferase [Candidatus Angelobacter sp.]